MRNIIAVIVLIFAGLLTFGIIKNKDKLKDGVYNRVYDFVEKLIYPQERWLANNVKRGKRINKNMKKAAKRAKKNVPLSAKKIYRQTRHQMRLVNNR